MTEREKAILVIEVELDPIPGMFHTPESARVILQNNLEWNVGHYNPQVTIATEKVKEAFESYRSEVLEIEEPRTCEAMHWYAENHGVQCILPWGHELEGEDAHDFDQK